MQSHDQTLVGLTQKLTAFKGKLKFWKRKLEGNKITSSPTLNLLLKAKILNFLRQKILP
jgi:hypothetical protein